MENILYIKHTMYIQTLIRSL